MCFTGSQAPNTNVNPANYATNQSQSQVTTSTSKQPAGSQTSGVSNALDPTALEAETDAPASGGAGIPIM